MPDAITPYTVLPVCNHLFSLWCLTPSFSTGCMWNYSMFCQGAISVQYCRGAVTPCLSGESSIFCSGAITLCTYCRGAITPILPRCNHSMFCWGAITPCFQVAITPWFARVQVLHDLLKGAITSWFARVQVLYDILGHHHMFCRGECNHFLFCKRAMNPIYSLDAITPPVYTRWITILEICLLSFFFFISSMVFRHGICHLPVSISFQDISYVFIFPQNN